LKCRIDPEQSPYTCMLPEHKPVRRGREMIDLLAVEEPKPKPAKIRAVSYEAAIDQLFRGITRPAQAIGAEGWGHRLGRKTCQRRRVLDARGRRPINSLCVGYREYRILIVNDKDRQNLGGICPACVRTHRMMGAWHFRPVLAGAVCSFRSVVDLTADLSLDDGCVNERRLRVGMRRRVAAGSVLDQNSLDALAGNSRQSVLIDERYFGVLRARKLDRRAKPGLVGSDIHRSHQGQGSQGAHRRLHGFVPSLE
jgi:hypothetical protein